MSEINKSFRRHCNIDVSIDRENNSVSVDVSYKPELLEVPQCWTRHSYDCNSIVEELLRQGISVGPASEGSGTQLDNTTVSSKYPLIKGTVCFPLAPQSNEEVVPAPVATPSLTEESKKRRPSSKTKTNK